MDDLEIFRKLAQCEDKEQMQRCIDEYYESHKLTFTNADSIRAMSDEELAVWITSIRLDTINEMCKMFGVEIEMPPPTAENTADVYEWLKQPAES